MTEAKSGVTIHMAASLDGFIASKDGGVEWMETTDEFPGGAEMVRKRPRFANIWFVGGGSLCGECLRLGLADEIRFSIMPVVIGEGIPFFRGLDRAVPLHLVEAKAYRSGMVALHHEVRK